MRPGLVLQQLTTREPDLDQLEVAITSLRAVMTAEQLAEVDARVGASSPAHLPPAVCSAAVTDAGRPRGDRCAERGGLERDEVVVVCGVAVVEPVEHGVDEVVEERLRGPLRDCGRDERRDDLAGRADRDVAQLQRVSARTAVRAPRAATARRKPSGHSRATVEQRAGRARGLQPWAMLLEEQLGLAVEDLLEHGAVQRSP